MKYVCDTNVFDAYGKVDAISDLFMLDADFLMFADTIEEELIDPKGFGKRLLGMGLHSVELSDDEVLFTVGFSNKYIKLSRHDTIALAIAKDRNLTLLTGDKNLRKAAVREKVSVMGSIGILDELLGTNRISGKRFLVIAKRFLKASKLLRLPEKELLARIDNIQKQMEG